MSNAHGFFHDFQGTVTFVPGDPKTWASEGTIQVESIDTKSAERDRHLLSKDFFEVGKFPEISFRATAVSQVAKNSAQVAGFIKIRGIEKPVSIRVQNLALSQDKNGIEHLKFIATAKIDRRDFGITYSSAGPGKMMLGNDVMITIEADAIRKD
jgi:polyisoprenoid-binding protein YceI